ncbi:unique cartilage matrix-associated protein [Camelus ferus]|uniref:Unique cartilage matrix-associated protein n=1 Tax=Camelus ferus TaxID=419612 RepID=A0A8B8SIH5_CAMFR|nr:unique cartilage matrix-associated protein [Camelus ferus]
MQGLRRNDWCSPKHVQLSLLLGATLASSPLSQWRTGSGCGLTSCGEHHEEQRNESENFAEEQNDEQEERSREPIEQWRQWHYDGLYPSYLYNRHI